MSINRDDWLRAVTEVGEITDDREAITVSEFAELFKVTEWTAARMLIRMEKAKRAVRTQKVAPGRDGRKLYRVAYRLMTQPKPKRKQ